MRQGLAKAFGRQNTSPTFTLVLETAAARPLVLREHLYHPLVVDREALVPARQVYSEHSKLVVILPLLQLKI